ncbi:histidinol-phosphate transaminase [Calothrix sp. PCC 6303]|uniref:histidinol-phosphate transaminase n=1 Tax=Calothrix sp. PCC 6303 TaxID=1170562 RepID=UPI0002A02F2E|nr:histidinol-phosphate transaminase [Calothrix sp. PCC 6303]AFZ04106.1 Histidinol-phosphate aminotransferase [Calothrix sp. PCC 6303]
MFPFIREDLVQFNAYKPHPSGENGEAVPAKIDRLDANESPYDLPSEIKQKLADEYKQQIETNRYPDGGHGELKSAIALYVNESSNLASSTFSAENISVGSGSDEIIRSLLIACCLCNQGSILVANPTFSMYAILAETLGIPVHKIGRNEANFEIDLQAAANAIQNPGNIPIRVVFMVHPNSPTANPLTIAEIRWLRSLPEDILVVIDEAYFEFSQDSLVGLVTQHPNWLIMRTFSKAFRLAGMRVGYCVAHAGLIEVLEKVRLPYNLPSFSITAALLAIQNRQTLLAPISQMLEERTKVFNVLSQMPELQVWDSAANFIYLRPKSTTTDAVEQNLAQLTQQLKSQGTSIRHTGGGLRITIGTPEENKSLLNRLQTPILNLQTTQLIS